MPSVKSARMTWNEYASIDKAIAYIDKHYAKKLSGDQLSVEAGLNKKKMQEGFRKRTGRTLHDYILYVRVEKSKYLLVHTELTLKIIAGLTGFKTSSHFCLVFKNISGDTPMGYRLQKSPAKRIAHEHKKSLHAEA